ncbi:35069_t:CDS:2, partial [Gigaspora margarita]
QYPLQSYEIGAKVMRYKARLGQKLGGKLEEKWTGPYWIHAVMGNGTYKLRTIDHDEKVIKTIVHGSQLKNYIERSDQTARFRELEKTLQPLLDKLNTNEELEIKGRQVVFRSQGQIFEETIERSDKRSKAQQIHENMPVYLQYLNQDNDVEPIMPIETASRTWEEKLHNICEEIETLNPRVQSNAQVLEVYYKIGDLMSERCWSGDARGKLCQRLTKSKGGLKLEQLLGFWPGLPGHLENQIKDHFKNKSLCIGLSKKWNVK